MQAQGDDSLMRVFTNARLAQPFKALGKRVEVDLYARREPYACHAQEAELPAEVVVLTAAVDVQDTYLAYEVVGWGKGTRKLGDRSGRVSGESAFAAGSQPTQPESMGANRPFRLQSGIPLRRRALRAGALVLCR